VRRLAVDMFPGFLYFKRNLTKIPPEIRWRMWKRASDRRTSPPCSLSSTQGYIHGQDSMFISKLRWGCKDF